MAELKILLKDIPGVKRKVQSLFDRLETLRIPDSDFSGKRMEIQWMYEKANDKLDECLQIVYSFCKENNLI